MQLQLNLSDAEIRDLYTEYEGKKARKETRLSFLDWAVKTVTSKFSRATTNGGNAAVNQTLRPIFREQFEHDSRFAYASEAVCRTL
jgi:hypothetical protein